MWILVIQYGSETVDNGGGGDPGDDGGDTGGATISTDPTLDYTDGLNPGPPWVG